VVAQAAQRGARDKWQRSVGEERDGQMLEGTWSAASRAERQIGLRHHDSSHPTARRAREGGLLPRWQQPMSRCL
jgi:hypothetical protein